MSLTMAAPAHRGLRIAAAVGLSFTAIVVLILFLMIEEIVSFEMALLMLVALLGLYFGFGVLIAVYRLIGKLD